MDFRTCLSLQRYMEYIAQFQEQWVFAQTLLELLAKAEPAGPFAEMDFSVNALNLPPSLPLPDMFGSLPELVTPSMPTFEVGCLFLRFGRVNREVLLLTVEAMDERCFFICVVDLGCVVHYSWIPFPHPSFAQTPYLLTTPSFPFLLCPFVSLDCRRRLIRVNFGIRAR